jgi:hypothetical protein
MGRHGWAYRCTESGVSRQRTLEILKKHSFCWRSVFTKAGATSSGLPPLIARVRDIRIQDPLLIYYSTPQGEELLGKFLVRKAGKKITEVAVPALGVVDEAELGTALEGHGDYDSYPRDPYLKVYTGFFLQKDDYVWVPETPPVFPGNNAIIELD